MKPQLQQPRKCAPGEMIARDFAIPPSLFAAFRPNHTSFGRTRSVFLWQAGFAGLGLLDVLHRDGLFASAHAALTQMRRVVLNLNEFLYPD